MAPGVFAGLDAAQNREDSWWEGMKSRWSRWFDADQFAGLEQQVEQSTRSVVDLIVVFVAQTLLFPLLFLWLFYRLGALLWRQPLRRPPAMPHSRL